MTGKRKPFGMQVRAAVAAAMLSTAGIRAAGGPVGPGRQPSRARGRRVV